MSASAEPDDLAAQTMPQPVPAAPRSALPHANPGPLLADAADVADVADAASVSGYRVRFTGRGDEYFKIWAVNLALTLLTLGIYSAWAKVRRLRYFYANTTLDGSPFDFHGQPIAILRGRLVALAVLLAWSQSPKLSLWLYGATALLLLAGFPWLFWRSLRFRLGNTSYRGVRLNFAGSLGDAYRVVGPPTTLFIAINATAVLLPHGSSTAALAFAGRLGLLYLTLLAVAPYYYHRLRAYQHGSAQFGRAPFAYDGQARSFYWLALQYVLYAIGLLFTVGVIMGVVVGLFTARGGVHQPLTRAIGMVALGLIYLGLFCVLPFASMRTQNLVWRHTSLDGQRFGSALGYGRLLWVEASNWLLLVPTLGMFRPFGAIRLARVRTEAITFAGDPAHFQAASYTVGGPAGAEIGEMFGFDIAL